MALLTFIIHPDKELRGKIKTHLESLNRFEVFEFESETGAMRWMEKYRRPVDIILTNWELSSKKPETTRNLREKEFTRSAFIYPIANQEDLDWIRSILGSEELLDNILIKPFRARTLIQRLEQLLSSDRHKKPSVLMVDDDEGARETIREYLKHFGFANILEANNGKEALDHLKEHFQELALIVSDWEMPSMNGIQLLKKVKATPEYASIPFVMITSQSSIEQMKTIQAAEMGVNGYLHKPFNLQGFRSQLEGVFNEIERHKKAETWILEARTLMAHGNSSEAVQILTGAIQKDPKNGLLHEGLGDAYLEMAPQNNKQTYLLRAAEAFEKALGGDSHRSALIMKCFEVYSALGRMNDAIRILKQHLSRHGFDDELRTRLGKIYLQSGDYALAATELKRALHINPNNTEAQSLSQVLTSLHKNTSRKAS